MSTYGIYARVVNASEMSLVRSLVITTFWMESVSLGIIQLKLVFIKFSFLCDMNESSSRLRTPKTFDEEKDCLSILFQNLRLHEQIGVADFSRMARPKSAQDLHHLARRTVQRWRLGVDVLELTESIEIMNAKSLNYWQEVANKLPISRVSDTPLGVLQW